MCSGMGVIGIKASSLPLILRRSNVKQIKLHKKTRHSFHSSSIVATTPSLKETRHERVLLVHASDRNEDQDVVVPEDYVEALIESVVYEHRCGVLSFRLKNTQAAILHMYIGEFECSQIMDSINNKEMARPMSYDFMHNSLRSLGFRVSEIRVTELIGNTYHARVFYKARGSEHEISVDARPSDAVNLAIRFNAPLFVHKTVADRMGAIPLVSGPRSAVDVMKLCREEIKLHQDPTMLLKLQMQLAIVQERYSEAAGIRDEIGKVLASDRGLGMVVAMESALNEGRLDEALQIRDALKRLRGSRGGSGKHKSH